MNKYSGLTSHHTLFQNIKEEDIQNSFNAMTPFFAPCLILLFMAFIATKMTRQPKKVKIKARK